MSVAPDPIIAARKRAFELVDAGKKSWREVRKALELAGVDHTVIQRLTGDRWFHVTFMIRMKVAQRKRADGQKLVPRKPRR